jgi:biopolymer transport protein ExbD
MPVGTPPASDIKPEKIQIDIDEKSVVYWQGLPVSGVELEENMTALAQLPNQPEVHIRPNKASEYAVFANVLSSSKRKGLTKMAVIGSEQFVQ